MITFTTDKTRLGRTVATVDVTAPGTPLRSVARVNPDYLAADCFRLVFQKAFELSERPRMKAAFRFSSTGLDSCSDVRKVFNDNNGSGFNTGKYASAENVVTIASETSRSSREELKVPFGRLRSFRLQGATKAKRAFLNLAPVFLAVESVIRSHGRTTDAKVNADSVPRGDKGNVGQFDNDMQGESTFSVHKVSGTDLRTDKTLGINRKREVNFQPAASCGKVGDSLYPIQLKRVDVIARWANFGLRTPHFPTLFEQGYRRLDGFGGFLPCLNVKVGDKGRVSLLTVPIGDFVKGERIAFFKSPANGADSVKGFRELMHRFFQGFCLFPCDTERYSYRSIHIPVLPYNSMILQFTGGRQASSEGGETIHLNA